MYMTPVIGLTCFAIILVNWLGGFKYPKGIPAGLVAIAVGMLIAWGSNLFGLNYGGLSGKGVVRCVYQFRLQRADPGRRSRVLGLPLSRRHSGHRGAVRHL